MSEMFPMKMKGTFGILNIANNAPIPIRSIGFPLALETTA
jgi:hypothetical protein